MRLTEYERNWANKDAVEMIFVTDTMRIEGMMFKSNKVRVSDHLTNLNAFIVLTEVKVYLLSDNRLLAETEFMALNKESVQFAMEKASTRCHDGLHTH